jgi:hypothetical protein
MHAIYEQPNDRPTLYFEQRFAHPVPEVWAAIT